MVKIWKISLTAILLSMLIGTVLFAADNRHYVNARFGFSVDVPSSMYMKPAPANDDGRAFVDKATGLEIIASGSNNVMMSDAIGEAEMSVPDGTKSAVKSDKAKAEKDVTICWTEKNSVAWNRVILVTTPDNSDGVFIKVYAKYPKAKEQKCLDAVMAALKSLKSTVRPKTAN